MCFREVRLVYLMFCLKVTVGWPIKSLACQKESFAVDYGRILSDDISLSKSIGPCFIAIGNFFEKNENFLHFFGKKSQVLVIF